MRMVFNKILALLIMFSVHDASAAARIPDAPPLTGWSAPKTSTVPRVAGQRTTLQAATAPKKTSAYDQSVSQSQIIMSPGGRWQRFSNASPEQMLERLEESNRMRPLRQPQPQEPIELITPPPAPPLLPVHKSEQPMKPAVTKFRAVSPSVVQQVPAPQPTAPQHISATTQPAAPQQPAMPQPLEDDVYTQYSQELAQSVGQAQGHEQTVERAISALHEFSSVMPTTRELTPPILQQQQQAERNLARGIKQVGQTIQAYGLPLKLLQSPSTPPIIDVGKEPGITPLGDEM